LGADDYVQGKTGKEKAIELVNAGIQGLPHLALPHKHAQVQDIVGLSQFASTLYRIMKFRHRPC